MSSCVLGPSLPPWLKSQNKIAYLDVSNSSIFGFIPNWFWDISSRLTFLNMSHNELEGWLPNRMLVALSSDAVDLSFNLLEGPVPIIKPGVEFGEGFTFLRILILRSNAFSGELPPELSKLGSSQVLDLSRNDLTGSIPARLGDLKAIVQAKKKNKYLLYGDYEGHYYEESLNVYIKDQRLKYTKTLSLVAGIDLSDNNLTGNIPNEITKLSGLMVINLSRNHITYQIPETISNLRQLSYLDLSSNQFSGTIPLRWPSLTFLGSLNLSDNNLMGAIPYTGQVTTFDASAFTGNPNLCGTPL
ncbi:hypothetical protein RYX36_028177 [Vicia faba]